VCWQDIERAIEELSVSTPSDNYPGVVLRKAFQQLNETIVGEMKSDAVADILFEEAVISEEDNLKLIEITDRAAKTRHLLAVLHAAEDSQVFVSLRQAMTRDETCKRLVDDVDKVCSQLTVAGENTTRQAVTSVDDQVSGVTNGAASESTNSTETGNFHTER
jgi:hypothetical protein